MSGLKYFTVKHPDPEIKACLEFILMEHEDSIIREAEEAIKEMKALLSSGHLRDCAKTRGEAILDKIYGEDE